jgi:hypothetical protein
MTDLQQELLKKLENGLVHMVNDGHKEWAASLSPIVEYLYQGEPEMAVLEGEANGFSPEVLEEIRKTFDVRY